MEIIIDIVAVMILILGIIGCFVPAIPGPPLAYGALWLQQIGPERPFSLKFLLIVGLVVLVVSILDYAIPAFGAKKWGGSKYGMIGAFIGVFVGLFVFPPFGFLVFPLVGAFLGEFWNGAKSDQAIKAAFGTLVGLLFGTLIKFSVTVVIAYYLFTNL